MNKVRRWGSIMYCVVTFAVFIEVVQDLILLLSFLSYVAAQQATCNQHCMVLWLCPAAPLERRPTQDCVC